MSPATFKLLQYAAILAAVSLATAIANNPQALEGYGIGPILSAGAALILAYYRPRPPAPPVIVPVPVGPDGKVVPAAPVVPVAPVVPRGSVGP